MNDWYSELMSEASKVAKRFRDGRPASPFEASVFRLIREIVDIFAESAQRFINELQKQLDALKEAAA